MWIQKIRDQRGQALVEFAIVVPVLLLLLFGIVEFGRVFAANLELNNAAREAARYAVVNDVDTTAVETVIFENTFTLNTDDYENILYKYDVDFDSKPVDQTQWEYFLAYTSTVSRGDSTSVTVGVEYPVTIYFPVIRQLFDNGIYHATAVVTMRVESGR